MANENLAPRPLRRHTHVLDRGDEHWRGAVVKSIAGPAATIRMVMEAHMVRDVAALTADLPAGARAGDPLVCKVTIAAFPYSIAEIRGSHYNPMDGAPSDTAAYAARGVFFFGVVPRAITGETEVIPWD